MHTKFSKPIIKKNENIMKHSIISFACIAVTVLCTVYGQLMTKWRVNVLTANTYISMPKYYITLFFDPLFLSGLLAVIPAGLCWMYAIRHIQLSVAYPFIGLTFALLHEPVTIQKIIGTMFIVAGISIIAVH
jgi:drug/metabolite transporter (DMT)-like permease